MRTIQAALLAATLLLTVGACANAGEQVSAPPESGVVEESSRPNAAAGSLSQQPDPADAPSAREDVPGETEPAAAGSGQRQQQTEEHADPVESPRIKLSFGGKEAFATLYDTPAGRDLLSRLPLTLEFQDYVGAEKISYLAEPLTNESGPNPPPAGDFAYYAPWGNLALFYNDIPTAGGGLVILGSMETGKELLAGMSQDFTMTIELTN